MRCFEFTLVVKRNEQIAPKVIIDRVGTYEKLRCKSESGILWFFNEKTDKGMLTHITHTDTILFQPLTIHDFGTYYCYGVHLARPFLAEAMVYL